MYKEVLDYVGKLGEENTQQDSDADQMKKYMDEIAEDIYMEYKDRGLKFSNSSSLGKVKYHLVRYLKKVNDSGEEADVSISIYAEKSESESGKKARYCISIGVVEGDLHNDTENLHKLRQKYYSFAEMELQDGLCYMYKDIFNSRKEEDTFLKRLIHRHDDEKDPITRSTIKDRVDRIVRDGKDIELCYLVEDGNNKTEEQLREEVMKGVEILFPYYEAVLKSSDGKISKNNILYGPPGTGKTYMTAAYAVEICMEEEYLLKDLTMMMSRSRIMERYHELEQEGRIGFTTFHQSYGYEDFIEGIRPVLDKENRDAQNQPEEQEEKTDVSSSGTVSESQNQSEEQKPEKSRNLEYTIEPGVLKAFCEKAEKEREKPYVFIIDEINRGNISRIFGELITLIEESKRKGEADERSVILPYSKKTFYVPSNVYIIGTMNTADRSIALLDTALRRRFSFVEMMPDAKVLKDIKIGIIDVQKLLEIINKRIEALYDREHTIGHAYFCGLKEAATLDGLKNVFKKSVLPLLQEYFFDDYEKIAMVLGDNQKSNRDYKFIVEDNAEDLQTLFGKDMEEDMGDLLQRKRYMINEKAFDYAESYIQIYEPSRKH